MYLTNKKFLLLDKIILSAIIDHIYFRFEILFKKNMFILNILVKPKANFYYQFPDIKKSSHCVNFYLTVKSAS